MNIDFKKFTSEIAVLRTSLDHGLRERQISKRQFSERSEILDRLEQENVRLQQLLQKRAEDSKVQTPLLKTKMNEEERTLSIRILEEKFLFLDRLDARLFKLQKWCSQITRFSLYRYLIPFKLTWINREVKKIEAKILDFDDLDIELDQYIDNLSEQLSPRMFRDQNRDRFRKIIDLLSFQESLNDRIRRKQERIVELQTKMHNLKYEIEQNEHKKIVFSRPSPIPTAASTQSVVDVLGGKLLKNLNQCEIKIKVAEDFLDSMINDDLCSTEFSRSL